MNVNFHLVTICDSGASARHIADVPNTRRVWICHFTYAAPAHYIVPSSVTAIARVNFHTKQFAWELSWTNVTTEWKKWIPIRCDGPSRDHLLKWFLLESVDDVCVCVCVTNLYAVGIGTVSNMVNWLAPPVTSTSPSAFKLTIIILRSWPLRHHGFAAVRKPKAAGGVHVENQFRYISLKSN